VKVVRVVAIVFAVYVALGLAIDAAIGKFQPQMERTAMLRTFDQSGQAKETVLSLLDDNGQLWVESGHWFRGWYRRAVAYPDVELVRDGEARPYRAVPMDDAQSIATVTRLMGKGQGAGYWVGRAMLLWAPIKPVRLDPRVPSPS
jgi:hypothetical protein